VTDEVWFTQPMLKELLTGAIGALLGAWGGAWAAQRIASRAKLEDDIREEIARAKSAVELASTVCNRAIGMKKQSVLELKKHYDEKYAAVHEYETRRVRGEILEGEQLDLGELRFSIIEGLKVPIARLDTLVMEQLQIGGRPRVMSTALVETVNAVNTVIRVQNEIVRATAGMTLGQKVPLLFGVERNGVINEHYKESITQIHDRVDDCIWFSATLMTDVGKYGQTVEPKRWFRKPKYRVVIPTFDDEVRKEFFPLDSSYKTWIDNFRPPVEGTRGRRFGKAWHGVRRVWRPGNRLVSRFWSARGKTWTVNCVRYVLVLAVLALSVAGMMELWLVLTSVTAIVKGWFGP
jgi:hypothetical protein